MFCPTCGKEVDNTAKFCKHCGAQFVVAQKVGQTERTAPDRSVIKPEGTVKVNPAPAPAPKAVKQPEPMPVPKPVQTTPPKRSSIFVPVLMGILFGCLLVVGGFYGYKKLSDKKESSGQTAQEESINEVTVMKDGESAKQGSENETSQKEDVVDVKAPAIMQEEETREEEDYVSEYEEETEEEAVKGEESVYYPSEQEYVLPGSDRSYLSESDLYGLSGEELRIARNEIYARHGRRFTDAGLQAYFDEKDWYYGTIAPDDWKESVLNAYEIANRDLIVEYEKNGNTESVSTSSPPRVQSRFLKSITASSVLREEGQYHGADNLIDNDTDTAWVEGVSGTGVGQSIRFTFAERDSYRFSGMIICNGYQKSDDLFRKNGRVKKLRITDDMNREQVLTIEDKMGEQRIDFPTSFIGGDVTVTIEDVYDGSKYDDTCISELFFY